MLTAVFDLEVAGTTVDWILTCEQGNCGAGRVSGLIEKLGFVRSRKRTDVVWLAALVLFVQLFQAGFADEGLDFRY